MRMETPPLTNQNRSTADEVLAERIRLINEESGSLGAFFEHLRKSRRPQDAPARRRRDSFQAWLESGLCQ